MKSVKQHRTAGGVVLDAADRALVLLRDVEREGRIVHEVRLPKGHIDPGETAEQAAVREVCEESGYCAVVIVADLGTAESEYRHQGRDHQREEHYFLMRLTHEQRSAPQPTWYEETLFEPHWLALEEAAERMTYPSERDFIQRARAVVDAAR